MAETQELVGLEIGNYAVKIAELGGKPHKIRLKTLDSEILPAEESHVDKDSSIVTAIAKLYNRNKITTNQVAITLDSTVTAVKRMQIPKLAPKLLREAILWEAQQYFPFDLTKYQLDYEVLAESKNSPYYHVLLVAAPKAAIEHAVDLIKEAGLIPVVLDVPALAMENQYIMNYSLENSPQVCLMDIGARHTLINILRSGSTLLTHTLPFGGDNYTRVIQDKLGINYLKAETMKQNPEALTQDLQDMLQEVSAKLVHELKQFLESSHLAFGGRGVEKIFLSGGACSLNGFVEYLRMTVGKPIFLLNPLSAVRFSRSHFPLAATPSTLASMAIAIGLGVRRWPRVRY